MSIYSMVSCAKRELEMRRLFYPKRVADGRMSPERAEHEIKCMEAIVALLEQVKINSRGEVSHG